MTWKELQMVLIQMPICELRKPVTLHLGNGEVIKLGLEQNKKPAKNWRHAQNFKDLYLVTGGEPNE